jgi:hypothetical protein
MGKLRHFLKMFLTDCDAVVTVEFLIALPLLFGAFVLAYEFGRALWAFNVMTSDVESGLRYLTHTSATASDITAATNLVRTGSTTGTNDRSPWSWAVPSPTVNVTTSTVATGFNQSMTVITMSTAVPITLPFLDFIKLETGNSVPLALTLRVSDQASCLTGLNPSTPCQPN